MYICMCIYYYFVCQLMYMHDIYPFLTPSWDIQTTAQQASKNRQVFSVNQGISASTEFTVSDRRSDPASEGTPPTNPASLGSWVTGAHPSTFDSPFKLLKGSGTGTH